MSGFMLPNHNAEGTSVAGKCNKEVLASWQVGKYIHVSLNKVNYKKCKDYKVFNFGNNTYWL